MDFMKLFMGKYISSNLTQTLEIFFLSFPTNWHAFFSFSIIHISFFVENGRHSWFFYSFNQWTTTWLETCDMRDLSNSLNLGHQNYVLIHINFSCSYIYIYIYIYEHEKYIVLALMNVRNWLMHKRIIVGDVLCLMRSLLWEWLQVFMLLADIAIYDFYTINIIDDWRRMNLLSF